MKKNLLIFLFTGIFILAGNFNGNCQSMDIIYLKNGSIIKGRIVEQVPNKSITLETNDGSIFVYQMDDVEKLVHEKADNINKAGNKKSNKNTANYKKNCFGLDFGGGSVANGGGGTVDLGFRYLHNFSQYIGWDVFKIKAIAPTNNIDYIWAQAMSGIRVNSPRFAANMSAYSAFKAGYGYMPENEIGGFCCELEVGVNLTRKVFAGFAYSYQGGSGEVDITVGKKTTVMPYDIKMHYYAFRLGFNF